MILGNLTSLNQPRAEASSGEILTLEGLGPGQREGLGWVFTALTL